MITILRVTRPIIRFLESHSGTIINVGAFILMEASRHKTNVKFGSDTYGIRLDLDEIQRMYRHERMKPNNIVEQTIYALMIQGEDSSWDSDKRAAVEEILRVLKTHKGNLSESTLSFAIEALSNIGETSSWSSTKSWIVRQIAAIGRSV